MSGKCPLISVVTPVYESAGCLDELHRRVAQAVEPLDADFELVMVDDGSADGSWEAIRALNARDPRVRGVRLSRNFGQHYAITAGLDRARGEWVVVMDCDLQDRPEEIPALYARALEGLRIVFARRTDRRDGLLKRTGSRLFYVALRHLAGVDIDPRTANFGIFHRTVVENFRQLRERSRAFHVLVRTLGFPAGTVDVRHEARFAGRSAYDFARMFALAVDIIVSQSGRLATLSFAVGVALALFAFGYGLFLMARKVLWAYPVPGWTSVMVSLYLIGGLVFINLGLLGLYLGKTFDEVKRRPLYVVAETCGEDTAEGRVRPEGVG
ncbi:dolichol-phosphate mannosyltransferase [Desulfobaculum xiamenense]|uniref:Dolichol-phosphate mannosyltransferase n=1 Tax=Desulfobaculum xiamenense TaxID=995050 RepID=A0A846QRR4_9BACT|nr:glycosyltransferase family 2 protein [Desulfobaculum xiamenense]NJB69212.1 dolichol-phosphate mannosyltransferase [Desulfobaculum xiamenense]